MGASGHQNGILSFAGQAHPMTAPQRFSKFRHAQKNRGPYHRGQGAVAPKATPFSAKVAAASAAVFGIVLYSDQVLDFAAHPVAFARILERESAPPAGAYYPGCDAARAARVAPIYADEPGYRAELDRDGDGIACEPYHGR
jgi:hypothetical protein